MAKDWDVQVQHIFREANQCADSLATNAHDNVHAVTIFSILPHFISSSVHVDYVGVSFARFTSV